MANDDNEEMRLGLEEISLTCFQDFGAENEASGSSPSKGSSAKKVNVGEEEKTYEILEGISSRGEKKLEPNCLEPVEHIDDLAPRLFQRVLSYLRNWEQAPCRLVSRRWNDQILNFTKYPQHSYILLNYERVTGTGQSSIAEMFDSFNPILHCVRMIRVQQNQIGSCLSPSFAANISHLDLFRCGPFTWSTFLNLLISCHHLEEIRVRKCPFKWPFDAEEWRNKYVEWLGQISKCGNQFPNFKAVEFRVKDPHDVLYMVKLITEYSTRLERISFCCRTPAQGLKLDLGTEDLDDMYETVIELFDAVVELVNKFSQNLELFHSYLIDPSPHRVNNNNNNNNNKTVTASSNHLGREEATIMNRYCAEVLARLDWTSMSLKSFCLYGGEISPENIPKQTDILCNFIKSQGKLEKVILPRIRFATSKEFEDLIVNIPKTVRCIRVPTFGHMPDCLSFDYKLNEYYIETHGSPDLQTIIPPGTILPNVRTFSFYNCSDWVWQTVKTMTIVNSFPCLTDLLIRDDGIHQCTRIVDSDVQNICRYLPNLRKLHMTNVVCCTDFGFTGIFEKECRLMNETGMYVPSPGSKIGYSLSSLKNLEYLFLSNLGFRVTNVSMIHGFTFQNLRFMTLEGYTKVTPWGVEHLRFTNSKLKRWSLDFHDLNISRVVTKLQLFPRHLTVEDPHDNNNTEPSTSANDKILA